jgi:hypothetical protein
MSYISPRLIKIVQILSPQGEGCAKPRYLLTEYGFLPIHIMGNLAAVNLSDFAPFESLIHND